MRPASSAPNSPPPDVSQWHLPAPDPQNQGKYMYKLHTVDVYLWTAEDGSLFLDSLKRVAGEGQIRVSDAPPAEHRDSMSPIVQQLERVAVSTPSGPVRTDSISTTQSQPTRATPVSPPASVSHESTFQYVPIAAYNPAAPTAPEPIAHREKTPPPVDASSGTGLKAASQYDAGAAQFAGPPQQAYGQQPFFSGPPGQPQQAIQHTNTGPYTASPPQPQQSPYAPTFAAPPTQAQDPNAQFIPQQPQQIQRQSTMPTSFGPYAASTISSAVPGQQSSPVPSGAPPAYQASPAYPPQPSPGYPPQQMQDPNTQFMPQQPQQPNYVYGDHATSNISHSIHNQLYIPEVGSHGHGHGAAQAGPGQAGAVGKLEQKASKYEKKLNKFFKRLDSGV